MSWLQKLTPINLIEEKEKFFADRTYNPQFVYEEDITEDFLKKHGLPQASYRTLAERILKHTFYGRNEADLLMLEGKLLSQHEVTEKITSFLAMHNLDKRFSIVWSASFVSRASIDKDTIKLRSTAEFREKDTIGLIYHEIGTHALRRINYEKQPWYMKKNKHGITTNYLRTEEGLAALHSLLPTNTKLAYSTAIRYAAVAYAQNHSFAELWDYLGQYIQNDETRWMVTFRQKRGLTDTKLPGGYTKDLVYFEGVITVWSWLAKNNFDPTRLYYGKIALEDIPVAEKINPNFQPMLPSFYVLNPKVYAEKMAIIGQENNFMEVQDG